MITKKLVAQAYRQGKITLKIDPNMESVTVAAIGDNWFYFGGITADEMSPEEYKNNVPENDIINEIWDVLDEFRTENPDEYAYYESVLLESQSHWSEIRCDYMDEETMFWTVDAWKTPDDAESGEVIARIDDLTGRVIYNEPLARVDKYAQEIINDKLAHLDCPLKIVKKPACIDIHMPARHGTITASFEPDTMSGAGYDAVYLGMEPRQDPYVYFDLAAVRSHHDEDIVDILTWSDINDEDYTSLSPISGSEIKDLIDACTELNTEEE